MFRPLIGLVARYAGWLHTRWPAGTVERLPEVGEDGASSLPGLFVVGDLRGVPLLKLSAHSGTRAVRAIVDDAGFRRERRGKPVGVHDVVIVGAGVSGMAAALAARRAELDFVVCEAKRPFQTIADFPKGKPIYTYPTEMTPDGDLQPRGEIKEQLLRQLLDQTQGIEVREAHVECVRRRAGLLEVELAGGTTIRALRVIAAIGRSGNFRKLDVPGEHLDKVYNRLHDPQDFAGQRALVVGGGDSALEAAIALGRSGAHVTLSYRRAELNRPKPQNQQQLAALVDDPAAEVGVDEPTSERVTTAAGRWLGRAGAPGSVTLALATEVREIRPDAVALEGADGSRDDLPNDVVFSMIGREAPLDFFRRSGVTLRGETRGLGWLWVIGFFLAVFLFYDWKNDGFLSQGLAGLKRDSAFPGNVPALIASLGDGWRARVEDRSSWLGTLAVSAKGRSFYYTLLYTVCVGAFGWARIRRRRTPYVTVQTTTLFLIQLFPLFLLPELLLPWLGYNGLFDSGVGARLADALFEKYIPDAQYLAGQWPEWGHPRAYWRAYGLILAWPLMVYNVFTREPIAGWLAISFVQTCVLIPLLIRRFGKGAYCGWICSCGGLAETMGDTLRERMPHGPRWNRLNMVGQALLAVALALLALRIVGWVWPATWVGRSFDLLVTGQSADGVTVNPLSWKWTVDVLVAGVLGVGLYVKYSGRVWCRFACPLAALMHVYARFSRFRILAEKKKCISCNVCTSACHQGIDVMSFANKGEPMADPQCVRCSACVQACPTGVLSFGTVDGRTDRLAASPVRMREERRSSLARGDAS